jgi:hypothetical protein
VTAPPFRAWREQADKYRKPGRFAPENNDIAALANTGGVHIGDERVCELACTSNNLCGARAAVWKFRIGTAACAEISNAPTS